MSDLGEMPVDDSFVDARALFFIPENIFVIINRKLTVMPLIKVLIRPFVIDKDIAAPIDKGPNNGKRFVCVGIDNLIDGCTGWRKNGFFEDVDLGLKVLKIMPCKYIARPYALASTISGSVACQP